jgi:zinc transport system ATP-binding protein
MSEPLIRMRDVGVTLGGNEVLRGLECELERGRVTAVIGLNGAGKTTLLRAVLKEVEYTGEIRFLCGHDHSKPTPEYIGYVPQKLRIDGNLPLTVLDLFGLCLRKRPLFLGLGGRFRERVKALLRGVGVEGLIDRAVEKMSGGELQRVLLALALEPRPELLLLDEPAAGIDFQMQQSFYNLIGELNTKLGVTVLLVSHDLSMVSRVAHHVLCLKDGRVECQGEPREILRGDHLSRIFGAEAGLFVHHAH